MKAIVESDHGAAAAEAGGIMVPLYFASCRAFNQGDRLVAAQRSFSAEQLRCEQRLAATSLRGLQDRMAVLFAADDPSFAAAYLASELWAQCDKRLYRITMPLPKRHPMVLVNLVCNAEADSCAEVLAREYWRPQYAWNCWEYIDTELTVLGTEPWPDAAAIAGAKFRYGEDLTRGKTLCP